MPATQELRTRSESNVILDVTRCAPDVPCVFCVSIGSHISSGSCVSGVWDDLCTRSGWYVGHARVARSIGVASNVPHTRSASVATHVRVGWSATNGSAVSITPCVTTVSSTSNVGTASSVTTTRTVLGVWSVLDIRNVSRVKVPYVALQA